MSCNHCTPNGWRKKVCNFCGTSKQHEIYISISIATEAADELFPYTETDLCLDCWKKYGTDAAFNHNNSCRGNDE